MCPSIGFQLGSGPDLVDQGAKRLKVFRGGRYRVIQGRCLENERSRIVDLHEGFQARFQVDITLSKKERFPVLTRIFDVNLEI